MASEPTTIPDQKINVPWTGYIALAFAIIFFSGLFMNETGALRALDFSRVSGTFGKLGTLSEGAGKLASNFRGTGGTGPKDAILLALTIIPQIMFALGVVRVIERLGAFAAAQKIISPFTRLILGLPGICTIPIIAGLQNSDSGASIIKQMTDEKAVTEKERLLFLAFHFPAPALIVNYFALTSILFPYMAGRVALPLVIIIVMKFIGANIFRLFIIKCIKEDLV